MKVKIISDKITLLDSFNRYPDEYVFKKGDIVLDDSPVLIRKSAFDDLAELFRIQERTLIAILREFDQLRDNYHKLEAQFREMEDDGTYL